MTKELLMRRMLCSNAKVDWVNINSGRLDDYEMEMLIKAQAKIDARKIFIIDQHDLTIGQVRAIARRAALSNDNIGLIVIDYLQLLSAGKYFQNTNDKISYISRMAKGMARELKVPVLCLSQLNRKVEERPKKRPQLSDLRDSGSLEQDPDVVLLIYRPEHYWPGVEEHQGKAEIIVAKQRSGPAGFSVQSAFQKQYGVFADLETRLEPKEILF